jgi:hypothetical protein
LKRLLGIPAILALRRRDSPAFWQAQSFLQFVKGSRRGFDFSAAKLQYLQLPKSIHRSLAGTCLVDVKPDGEPRTILVDLFESGFISFAGKLQANCRQTAGKLQANCRQTARQIALQANCQANCLQVLVCQQIARLTAGKLPG